MPRRILLLVTDLQIGGTPTVVREIAVRLRVVDSVEVEVACLAGWGPVADQLRDAGVNVTALGAASVAAFPLTLLRLIRLIRGERFDTVFSFLMHANALAAVARMLCPGVRFLQSIQTTQPNPRWHWSVQRLAQFAAAKVVVPSPSAATIARRWAGVPESKIAVVPNAVDTTSFDEIYRRNVDRIPSWPIQVGFIGRLDPIKRVPQLVRAIPALLGDEYGRPRVHLHIFGEGSERQQIEAEVARLRLERHVTLHGAVARPHEALAMLDVLVLPSRAEGFGLVLIEAMAAGVGVVAADVPGIRDVVDHPRTGILADPEVPQSVARAILHAAGSGRNTAIFRARSKVIERFSWPIILGNYRKLLHLTPRTRSEAKCRK